MSIIGREKEIQELTELYNSGRAEFIAVYGRRRVGKTFLVNEVYRAKLTFRHAGLSPIDKKNSSLKAQLENFYQSLVLHGMKKTHKPTTWLEAFFMLETYLQDIDDGSRQIVFLDELPWMDTPRSGFITGLEAFWNGWACSRNNLLLVVAGSANSWIMDHLINNHGGLYGRVTHVLELAPFTLHECEEFYRDRGIQFSRYDITQSYMVLGGIPYYMGYMSKHLSLAQNIDELFFKKKAKLKDEYDRLFSSVFQRPEDMKRIVELLCTRHSGFTRKDISEKLHIPTGNGLTKMLGALQASDFIERYVPFGESKFSEKYKLIDPFCRFYQTYVRSHNGKQEDFWTQNIDSQRIVSWRGIAFEEVCFMHIKQIKHALGISGVNTEQFAWTLRGDDEIEGTQIDMLIKRRDNVINMCEMKFYSEEFSIDRTYHMKLVHRRNILEERIPRKMAIYNALITTYGLQHNEYFGDFVSVITLDDLFNA